MTWQANAQPSTTVPPRGPTFGIQLTAEATAPGMPATVSIGKDAAGRRGRCKSLRPDRTNDIGLRSNYLLYPGRRGIATPGAERSRSDRARSSYGTADD